MMLRLLTVAACTYAFAPRVLKTTPQTRRQFTEVPESLETARFVPIGPQGTDKPVLLALGGLDGPPRVGATNWKRLSEWFDVRALVLDPSDRSSHGDLVRLAAAAAAAAPGGKVHVVAESMGALAALGLALARPERVESLVLCNSASSYARAPVSRITGLLPRLPTRLYETLAPVVTPIMGRPGWASALSEGLVAALPRDTLTHRESALLRAGAASVNDALKRLKGPPTWAEKCVFVASENDAVLPSVREANRLARLIRGATVRVERGAPHVLFDAGNLLDVYADSGILPTTPRQASGGITATTPTERSMLAARRLVSPRFFSTAADGSVEDGLFNVPTDGPVLFVGNHQLFGLDGVHIVEEFLRERRLALTPLVYPPLLADESPLAPLPYPLPGSAAMLRRFGGEPAGAKTLIAALKRGAKALVFPGGAREVFKRKGEAYTLRWPSDSSALVRIAAKFNATIVPFAGVGGDEFFGNEAYAFDTDDLVGMDNRVGDFLRNRTDGLISLVEGDTFVPPLMAPNAAPRRNYYLFGRPFHTAPVDPTNADACDALYGAVRTQVELQMEYLLQRRGDDPYDDFVKRLAYEVGGSIAPTFSVDDSLNYSE